MNNKDLHRVVYRNLLCRMGLGTSLVYYNEQIKKRTSWPSEVQERFREKYEDS
jgi:hypothetical protein